MTQKKKKQQIGKAGALYFFWKWMEPKSTRNSGQDSYLISCKFGGRYIS